MYSLRLITIHYSKAHRDMIIRCELLAILGRHSLRSSTRKPQETHKYCSLEQLIYYSFPQELYKLPREFYLILLFSRPLSFEAFLAFITWPSTCNCPVTLPFYLLLQALFSLGQYGHGKIKIAHPQLRLTQRCKIPASQLDVLISALKPRASVSITLAPILI